MSWLQACAVVVGAAAVAAAGVMLGAGPGPAAPLAATLALVVATPAAPAARPRVVLAGYALSTLAGLLASAVVGAVPDTAGTWWRAVAALALGAGLAVVLMARFGVLHPPAAAAGCVVALQPVLHWPAALVVVAAGAAVAGAAAVRAGRPPWLPVDVPGRARTADGCQRRRARTPTHARRSM